MAQPDLIEDDRELLKIIRVGILIDRASTQDFHDETDFDGRLPAMHLSLLNVATRFDGLEPAQFLDGFLCALDGPINGILDRRLRGASEFHELINGVFHLWFFQYFQLPGTSQPPAGRESCFLQKECYLAASSSTQYPWRL